jgi:hypothetical protein
MNQKGSGANGDEMAFNIAANDNDGTTDGTYMYMRWTGGDHQNVDGWGKVTLKGNSSKIIPVKVSSLKSIGNQEVKGIFDIYGRKINAGSAKKLAGIHFIVKNDGKSVKQIVLR